MPEKVPNIPPAQPTQVSVVKDAAPRRGVKTKLIGVVLIGLGTLNSMLAWKGGFVFDDFPWWLLGLGIAVFIVGVLRQRGG